MSSLGVTIQSYHRRNGSKDSQDRVVTIGDRSDRARVFPFRQSESRPVAGGPSATLSIRRQLASVSLTLL